MLRRRRKKRRNEPQSGEMALQITAMADIFTILLVFLLKSFSAGAVQITPSPGLQLPDSTAEAQHHEALKIEVTEQSVLVEGESTTELKGFRFPAGGLQKNGASASLSESISKYRKRQMLIAKANPDVKVDPKVMIIADQRAPYATIKSVLASAAVNGYTDFKLAVIRKE